jgi:predicted RNase H-like HicB family nuclease
MLNYETIVFWSEEDQAFVAEVPELPGWMAHGESYEIALAKVQEAMLLWIDIAREFSHPIPTPKGQRLMYA